MLHRTYAKYAGLVARMIAICAETHGQRTGDLKNKTALAEGGGSTSAALF
ncbi:hypothetical protein [Pararhizobium arenae]|nr:hypothetical protein [Pararhizobium arenae]